MTPILTNFVSVLNEEWHQGRSRGCRIQEPGVVCTALPIFPFLTEDVFLLTSRDRQTPLLYAVFSTSR